MGAWAQSNPAPVRLAMVSTCGGDVFANEIAIAEAQLSGDVGIHLVERREIQKVMNEQSLWSCGLTDSGQALKAGKLLGADVFAAVETLTPTSAVPAVVIFDAHTGVTLGDVTLPAGNSETYGTAMAMAVREALHKRAGMGSAQRTVSLVAVSSVGLPQEMQQACEAVGLLLEQRLVNSPSLILLERRRLENVNKEPAQGLNPATNELASALTFIEITVYRTNAAGGLEGVARLADAQGKHVAQVKAAVPQVSFAGLAAALLPPLLGALEAAPMGQAPDAVREARRFYNESVFLLNNNNPVRALQTAEAAAALAPEDVGSLGQLALCLAQEAVRLLPDRSKGVEGTMPFALRSAELCLHIRQMLSNRGKALPLPGLEADLRLSTYRDDAPNVPGYWETVSRYYFETDAATQRQMDELARLLRESRVLMGAKSLRAHVKDKKTATEFTGDMNYIMQCSSKWAPSSDAWSRDMEWLMGLWMEVYRTNRLFASVRPMARLACFANGCAQPQNPFKKWSLQPSDLARLGQIFEQMAAHPDPAIQTYGKISQFALQHRGKKSSDEAMKAQYRDLMQAIRNQISSNGVRADGSYDKLFYTAARDLIDFLPEPDERRQEHQALFEWMLHKEELTYWTALNATDPNAKRFSQYSRYPYPFPTEPLGYTTNDFPRLLSNEQQLQELIASKTARDVDGSGLSKQFGSLANELKDVRKAVLALSPELDANQTKKVPWLRAEPIDSLLQGKYQELVRTLQIQPAQQAYQAPLLGRVVSADSNRVTALARWPQAKTAVLNCLQIPLDGGPAQSLTGPFLFPYPLTGPCMIHEDKLIIGSRPKGFAVYSLADKRLEMITAESGLPGSDIDCMAAVDGRLFVCFQHGPIASYDLATKGCQVLASQRAAESLSPLDNLPTGFEVVEMLPDPARHRVLFTITLNKIRLGDPLIGLWEINAKTGRLRQLCQTYRCIQSMRANGGDELLIYCTARFAPNTPSQKDATPTLSLASVNLRDDTARVLWQFDGGKMGPKLSADKQTRCMEMEFAPPFLHDGNQLWFAGWNKNHPSCLSLDSGEVYDFELPPTDEKPRVFRAFDWTLQGRQVLADCWGEIYVLRLPETNSPPREVPIRKQPSANTKAVAANKLNTDGTDELKAALAHLDRRDLPDAESVAQLQRMADNGDVRAAMWLARFYVNGNFSVPPDPDKGRKMAASLVPELEKLAEKGDADAQYLVGVAYYSGLGTERDLGKAVQWATRSADAGQPFAVNQLGLMFALGHGVGPDIGKARQLFSRAEDQGLAAAAVNLATYGDDWRDDTQRLKRLRTVPLVQALGMQKEEGIAFLRAKAVISDPKAATETVTSNGRRRCHFRADGVLIEVDLANERIVNVEAHSKGFLGSEQFKGEMPLGIGWNAVPNAAQLVLGEPDSSGSVSSDHAYGMAYRMENIYFAVMFATEGDKTLKLWRAYEKWAEKTN
jgi:hypothetical protein